MSSNTDPILPTQAPVTLSAPDACEWDQHCDVLVVGLGAAGASTAISACENGANVLVLDRFGNGGATAKSGGIVYAGGGTPPQQRAGIEDSPQNMFNYLKLEVDDAVSDETLQQFCNDSPGLISWLESMGARFDSQAPFPKTSYPRNGVFLYYSGNEALAESAAVATPAPRGHRTADDGLSGPRLFAVLEQRVRQLEIPVLKQCAVHRLIQDESGRVIGVEYVMLPATSRAAQQHAKLIKKADKVHEALPGWADKLRLKARALEREHGIVQRARARHGVVLCTGGFVFNTDMVREHAPKFANNMRLGSTGCDGSGIRLGHSVGAELGRMDKASAWRFINPPQALIKGVAVNAAGQRFCVESAYGARIGVSMCETAEGQAWLILDKATRSQAWKQIFRDGLWFFQSIPALFLILLAKRAPDLATLERKTGIPAGNLQATVARYNQGASGEQPDAFNKLPEAMQPLSQPPFSALNISANNPLFPLPTITLGGLRVNEKTGAVRNTQGQDIAGLYAAGRSAIGVASNNYVSGLSIADCLWSGRRTGRTLAALATGRS